MASSNFFRRTETRLVSALGRKQTLSSVTDCQSGQCPATFWAPTYSSSGAWTCQVVGMLTTELA